MSSPAASRNPRMVAVLRIVAPSVGAALLVGCASISTSPKVATGATAPVLRGHLDFDGNREYLPAPLVGLPPADAAATTVFRYRYDVKYDETDLSVLALFNPLTLLGCPTGSVTVVAQGHLEVSSNGRPVARYSARAVASRLRTVYSGDPLSDLRRSALRATADSIVGQVAADGATLAALPEPGALRAPETTGGEQ